MPDAAKPGRMSHDWHVVGRIGEDETRLLAGKERGVYFLVSGVTTEEEMLT